MFIEVDIMSKMSKALNNRYKKVLTIVTRESKIVMLFIYIEGPRQ